MSEGYAASANDTGHQSSPFSGAWAYSPTGLNSALIADFAHRANHEMAVKSKQLIEAFYGMPPSYSYFNGCSTGGREGLTEAMRYPEDSDGIVAASPAINWPGRVPSACHLRRARAPGGYDGHLTLDVSPSHAMSTSTSWRQRRPRAAASLVVSSSARSRELTATSAPCAARLAWSSRARSTSALSEASASVAAGPLARAGRCGGTPGWNRLGPRALQLSRGSFAIFVDRGDLSGGAGRCRSGETHRAGSNGRLHRADGHRPSSGSTDPALEGDR